MPNKRSKRNLDKFPCPYCDNRLWRIGSSKHYLFYQGKEEMQKGFQLSNKKACFLAQQYTTLVDRDVWLEEFFCEKDGKIWMRLSKKEQQAITAIVATSKDWQRSTHTIDAEHPNGSVSEFTYRMSRRAIAANHKPYYD